MPSRSTAFAARLRVAFASPRIIVWATALAALLSVPVLFHGFEVDDHTLRGLMLRVPPFALWSKSPFELFSFYDGDRARTMSLVDHGFSPWWTDPTLRMMFFRPLSSLTHWVDFRLWPDWPSLMHLQTVLWYLAVVAAAGALYRRVLGPGWVAGFAAVVFAVDHNHGVLVEWIANRSALIGAAFGLLSLLLHDGARRGQRPRLALASAACLALGLLGGEVALGAVGYLVGYALFLDEAPPRARSWSLAPHLVVLGAWLVVYRGGGFGARGSGIYLDPGQAPLAFLGEALSNVPLLLQTELGGLPPDSLVFVPHPPPLIWVVAVGLVGVAFVAMAPLRGDRRARFFLTGALLSMLPAAATFPAGRLMLLPGLGLLGLVALVVEGVVDRTLSWRPGPARWAAVYTAAWVGGGHLFASPLTMIATSHQLFVLEHLIARYGDDLGEDPALAGTHVVMVNAVDTFFSYYIIGQRLTAGRVAPGKILVLAPGTRTVELSRRDVSTLVVRSDEGFYRTGTELLTRSPSAPMPVGTRVVLAAVTVEVSRTNAAGVPTEAVFRFERPLEDASLRWVEWRGRHLVPFALPAIGEERRIEAQTPWF